MANSQLKKITINGTTYEVSDWFGICSTAAATQTKSVTIDGFNSDSLNNGVRVSVLFTAEQAYDGTPILRVNTSNNSYSIYYNETTFASKNAWKRGDLVTFTYFSGGWYMDRRDYLTLADLPVYDGTVT